MREARAYGRLRHLAPTQGYRALVASPLHGSSELAGVIVAYSVAARQFSEPELELIELLGGQAAMALETARLRAEQQEVIRELSLANDEMRRGRAVLEWAEQQHHKLMQLVLDEDRAAGAGERARVDAPRLGHGGGYRRPRAGQRPRRRLPPAAARPRGGRARRAPHLRLKRCPVDATWWPGCRFRGSARRGGLGRPGRGGRRTGRTIVGDRSSDRT